VGLRFSRRIKIAPGVRLNLGLRGVSVSAGVRGAGVTLGRHGLFGNVGLPGTGLSYRTKLAGGKAAARQPTGASTPPALPPPPGPITLRFEGARVLLLDERGRELSPAAAEAACRAYRSDIAEALRERAEALNGFAARQLEVHLDTPPPAVGRAAFDEPKPAQPPPGADGSRDERTWGDYMSALAGWRARQAEHARGRGPLVSESAAASPLEQALAALVWPRETQVSFALADAGRVLRLDVDLPEFDDLPAAEVQADVRGLTLTERALTAAARRRAYARHVHAVLFRLVGEAFAALDSVERVTAAGYTQRISAATGREVDDYILELDVDRRAWAAIDFGALDQVDPQAALAAFRLRRDLSRANEFRAIAAPDWVAG
jgi:hypothetical protein